MSAIPAPRHARDARPLLDPAHQLEEIAGIGMALLRRLDALGGRVLSWRAARRAAAVTKNRISATSAMIIVGCTAILVMFAWGAAANLSGENAWMTAGPAGAAAEEATVVQSAASTPASTPAAATMSTHSAMRKGSTSMSMHAHHAARAAVSAGLAGGALIAGGVAAMPAAHAAQVPAAHHAAATVHKTLTIITNDKKGWPEYKGAAVVTLPKNATVVLTIRSYDDGAAPLPSNVIFYDKVMGTVGSKETVDGKSVSSVANKDISHTFTIPNLGINLPIPAAATGKSVVVQATIHTGKAGTYNWQCYAPCGSGKNGEQGAMVDAGYMKGVVKIG